MEALMTDVTLLVFLTMLANGSLAGRNMMQGLGKDIERGGEKLQGTARDAK
jgi:predicted small secreted protein